MTRGALRRLSVVVRERVVPFYAFFPVVGTFVPIARLLIGVVVGVQLVRMVVEIALPVHLVSRCLANGLPEVMD